MTVQKHLSGNHVPVKIWTEDVEAEAIQQLVDLSTMPILHSHVAVMPDVHAGKGSTVGTVFATKNALIPAAVGVDIGCGMVAVKTSLTANDLPANLSAVRSAIEAQVPVGFSIHESVVCDSRAVPKLKAGLDKILAKHQKIGTNGNLSDKWARSLGTLGGGNHFIELCLDESNAVWVMLHSGSRAAGNIIGSYFIEQAKEVCNAKQRTVPNKDLSYLDQSDELFADYWQALSWAQEFASVNRATMLRHVIEAMRKVVNVPFSLLDTAINCHHNYASREIHNGENLYVTRKGAINAQAGKMGIIPGSMGAKSFIVRGLGNSESFCSCSHGAGRRMSRTAAKKVFTVDDLKAQTQGVECKKDESVLDEIPQAYKSIDQVMANQSDLVEIVATLKQVMCIKG